MAGVPRISQNIPEDTIFQKSKKVSVSPHYKVNWHSPTYHHPTGSPPHPTALCVTTRLLRPPHPTALCVTLISQSIYRINFRNETLWFDSFQQYSRRFRLARVDLTQLSVRFVAIRDSFVTTPKTSQYRVSPTTPTSLKALLHTLLIDFSRFLERERSSINKTLR